MSELKLSSLLGLGLTAGVLAFAAASARSAELDEYVWDLSSLYANDAAWQAERATVTGKLKTVGQLKGTLGRDAKPLADGLDEISDLRARVAKMVLYTQLQVEIDSQSAPAKSRADVSTALESNVESAVSFLADEIGKIGEQRLGQWIRAEPRLDRHRRRINRILRETPHTLPSQAQAVVQSMGRWPQLAGDIFWSLHEADLGWPKIPAADGKETPVTLANFYSRLRRSQNQEERNAANNAFLGRLRGLENVFGLLYTRRIDADLTIARHRKFNDGIEAIWFLRDGMPRGSHRVMIDVARKNLGTLRRHVDLRRRVLGIEHISYGDLRATVPLNRQFTVRDAIENAVNGLAPMGKDYERRLRDRLGQRLMHLPPLPQKRFTFAVFPPVGGANPYILMSFRGNYRSSRALAGGMALMMAFTDIPREHALDTRDDPGIYSNAVIYTGNLLHDEYAKKSTDNREQRIGIISSTLDLIWSNFFEWIIFSELDVNVQDLMAKGEPPSGARISQMYLDLLREYYGPADRLAIDENFSAEWMVESVPFASYEHQFWPPAMAAACLLTEKLQAGDVGARKAMDEALGRGDLDLSYQLLSPAGIDMTTPEPYQAAIRRMNFLLDELATLLDGTSPTGTGSL
jgi:oligoendopeptidase F